MQKPSAGGQAARGTGKRARKEQRRREREAAKAKEMESATFASEVRTREVAEEADEEEQTPLGQQENAPAAFKEMLSEFAAKEGDLSSWSWEEAMRLFITDRRYGAVKTLTQKKDLFAEWQDSRRDEDRATRKAARKEARAAMEMGPSNVHRRTLQNIECTAACHSYSHGTGISPTVP